MSGRAYDYASPGFGSHCAPPSSWSSPSSRDTSYRSSNRQSLVKQASITRTDSTGRVPPMLSRVDTLTRSSLSRQDSNPRSQLTRADSSSSRSTSTLTRTDSNPRSPLTRQESGTSRFDYSPPAPTFRSNYADRFRNFDLM